MALQSPQSIDVLDIQFKLHDKFTLFNGGTELRSHVNLLSVASNQGLLFAGNPNAAELKVVILKDVVDSKSTGEMLHVRVVQLPNIPNALACSADGTLLAVNYSLNGSGFLQIYSVPSFVSPNIKSLHNLRLSPEDNVFALQLLWNPVLTTNIAVVVNNGALNMYTLQDGGQYEMYSMDKSQQVKCGCWSPKGKQIVLGFPNGKLQQFKPDLTPAKTIACPPGVHPGPFNTIALHWLSTFQFAVVFLQQGEDMAPSLYIVNAPKGGTPSYINYYDICYSATGPRAHQVSFTHIQQWNLLLVTSANGVEVGILGTKETADTPTWVQYTLLDEARIEMPLTDSNDETYPIGFALDTSSSHQLTIGEHRLPVMPMVNVLSSHGHLVCFNFLNLTGAVGICSPPPPIMDASGQFRALEESVQPQVATDPQSVAAPNTSLAFAPAPITSTPAMKDKSTPLFSGLAAAPTAVTLPGNTGNLFSQVAASPQPTGLPQNTLQLGGAPGLGGFGGQQSGSTLPPIVKPVEPSVVSTTATPQQQQQLANTNNQKPNKELSKPLYTVPPTFNPAVASDAANILQLHQQHRTVITPTKRPEMNVNELDEVVKQMIAIHINSFSLELKQMANRNKGLMGNIGNPVEMRGCTKRLNDLQEILAQANDRDFEMDVQNLRQSLNESYAMLTECRTKLDMFKNPDITRLTSISTFDPINRRQLAKLQSYLATNQAQMQQLQQQIDAQWSCYQDLVRRNTKTQMHVPCLDGIYQRMTKLKDLIVRQRTKLNYLKTKLKQKGVIYKISNVNVDSPATTTITKADTSVDSLTDSILSISLSQTVDANRCKLTDEKISSIRNFTRQQQSITMIKPQRPNRVGLKSEVILETKLQSERKAREGAAIGLMKMQQEKVQQKPTCSTLSVESSHAQLAKPTATKPMMIASMQPQTAFAPPTQTQTITPNFNFGGASPFVKTSSASSVVIKPGAELPSKPFANAASASGGISFGTPPTFGGFVSSASATPLVSFGQPKPTASTSKPESLKEALSTPSLQTPISFSAKIISGETVKLQPNVGANTITATTSGFAALPTTNSITQPLKSSSTIETKKPDETQKLFNFAATSTALETTSSSMTPFSGFTNTATAKTSLFDGGTKSTSLSTSNFSFGGFGASLGATTTSIQPISNASAATTTSSTFNFGSSAGARTTAITGSSAVPAPLAKHAPTFAGFNKPVDLTITPTSNATSSEITSFAASNALATDTASSPSVISAKASITSATSDPTNELLGSINICMPTTKGSGGDTGNPMPPPATQNIFGGIGSSVGEGTFSFNPSAGALKSPFDAASTVTGATITTLTSTAATETATIPSTALGGISFAATGVPTSPPMVVSTASATKAAPVTASSLFSGTSAASLYTPITTFRVSSSGSATACTTKTSAAVAPTSATSSIFGGTSTFMTSTEPTPASTTATSASNSFANANTAATSVISTAPTSPIGGTSLFGTATDTGTSTTNSIFGVAAPNAAASTVTLQSGNIFGGIPKPDQSVFGSPTAVSAAQPTSGTGGGLFAAAAAANPSPFNSSPASNISSGGSIFSGAGNTGGGAFGSPATASVGGGSIFGGNSTTTSPFATANSTSSIFGGAKSTETGNMFGLPSQPIVASGASSGGGSLFGQSAFSQQSQQSGGNLFSSAGAAAATSNQQPSLTSGFGSGVSIFGGVSANNASTGGSIFGGATNSTAPIFGSTATGGFSSFSQPPNAPAFGSPTAGGSGGAFAQTGASVAHTGFGSPQTSAFAKPIFSVTSAFGSPPAFGAQPSFGGAATFGSPKAFSSFSPPNVTSPTAGAFASPPQKNNLFEALGSTDSGLSFGNLAQTTNTNAPKPTFGGSSFMNYRA